MPLIFDIEELRKEVRSLVDKKKGDDFIKSKLIEDGVSLTQANQLLFYAQFYRNNCESIELEKKQKDKKATGALVIFSICLIVIVVCYALITGIEDSIIEGLILAFAIHQIIFEGIKYLRY